MTTRKIRKPRAEEIYLGWNPRIRGYIPWYWTCGQKKPLEAGGPPQDDLEKVRVRITEILPKPRKNKKRRKP